MVLATTILSQESTVNLHVRNPSTVCEFLLGFPALSQEMMVPSVLRHLWPSHPSIATSLPIAALQGVNSCFIPWASLACRHFSVKVDSRRCSLSTHPYLTWTHPPPLHMCTPSNCFKIYPKLTSPSLTTIRTRHQSAGSPDGQNFWNHMLLPWQKWHSSNHWSAFLSLALISSGWWEFGIMGSFSSKTLKMPIQNVLTMLQLHWNLTKSNVKFDPLHHLLAHCHPDTQATGRSFANRRVLVGTAGQQYPLFCFASWHSSFLTRNTWPTLPTSSVRHSNFIRRTSWLQPGHPLGILKSFNMFFFVSSSKRKPLTLVWQAGFHTPCSVTSPCFCWESMVTSSSLVSWLSQSWDWCTFWELWFSKRLLPPTVMTVDLWSELFLSWTQFITTKIARIVQEIRDIKGGATTHHRNSPKWQGTC